MHNIGSIDGELGDPAITRQGSWEASARETYDCQRAQRRQFRGGRRWTLEGPWAVSSRRTKDRYQWTGRAPSKAACSCGTASSNAVGIVPSARRLRAGPDVPLYSRVNGVTLRAADYAVLA